MIFFALLEESPQSLLMIGMGAVCGVVAMLYRRIERDNVRAAVQHERLQAEHTKCLEQHSASEVKTAVLSNDIGHLRERLSFFERLQAPPPAQAAPVASQPPTTPTQPIT